jgi:FkbM family methyltransferase
MYASVLCHGVWEPVESSVLASVLRPGDFAVDVGANHGWHSIGMARIVGGSGLVWAFEPVPRIAAALERNLSRNPGLKVEAFPLALGHSSGTATIHVFQGLPEGHASTRTLGREDYHRYDVPRRSLDEVLAAGAPRPALVKVDVEGSDLDVLKGASELARGPDAPMWLLEVNWEVSRAFGYEPPDLLTFLRELADYRTYRLGKGRAWPEVEPRSAPQASAWLAVPRHRLERIHRVRVNA